MVEITEFHVLGKDEVGYDAAFHLEIQCKRCGERLVAHVIKVYVPHSVCAICGASMDDVIPLKEVIMNHALVAHAEEMQE